MSEIRYQQVIAEIRKGHAHFGTWAQIGHATSAELLAASGFSWIAVDCEHTDIGISELAGMFRAISASSALPMVRVERNDEMAIRRPLDIGACGIIVPLVHGPEEARAAVRAAKFPPAGARGYSYCRANLFGKDFDSYAKQANDQTLLFVMVESKKAVENIDSILIVDGVDGVFVGTYDLSGSYGLPGQTRDPIILDALNTIVAAAQKHNKVAGIHLVHPTRDSVQAALGSGYTFLALGMDTTFIRSAARDVLQTVEAGDRDVAR